MLLSVNAHAVIGSELLVIIGCRLAHFIFNCDPPGSVERLAKCSPAVSCWLQSMVSRLSSSRVTVMHFWSEINDSVLLYSLLVNWVMRLAPVYTRVDQCVMRKTHKQQTAVKIALQYFSVVYIKWNIFPVIFKCFNTIRKEYFIQLFWFLVVICVIDDIFITLICLLMMWIFQRSEHVEVRSQLW